MTGCPRPSHRAFIQILSNLAEYVPEGGQLVVNRGLIDATALVLRRHGSTVGRVRLLRRDIVHGGVSVSIHL